MSSDESPWIEVKSKAKRKLRPKNPIQGVNFQKNRTNDPIFPHDEILDDPTNDHDDIREKDTVLENPLFWNKFALVGDIFMPVQEILIKYRIWQTSPIMTLHHCLQRVFGYDSVYNIFQNFDDAMDELGQKSIFISALPRFTPREYGSGSSIYFIHIRFNWYFVAAPTRPNSSDNSLDQFRSYLSTLGEKHTHIPISEGVDVEKNIENFHHVMRILEGRKTYDNFQPESNSVEEVDVSSTTEINPYYSSVPMKEDDIVHECKLYLEDAHSGYGEILVGKEKGRKIYLHNRKNCSMAFNGDIVDIMVFKSKRQDHNLINKEPNEPYTGCVKSVKSSVVKPVNKIFLCHLSLGTANLMVPICGTIPLIKVDNEDAYVLVEKHADNLKDGLKDVLGIDNILQTRVNVNNARRFSDKSFVIVKNLQNNLKTTLNKIYYVDCYRCDFIFLVLYRTWKCKYRFPLGEVVGLYTPDFTFQKTLNLIRVFCDVPVTSIDEDMELQNEIRKIKIAKMTNNSKNKSTIKKRDNKKLYFSLKYPNKQYNEIAFSFEKKLDKSFQIGVHVVDLSSFINEEEYLDTSARNRFFTLLLPDIPDLDESAIEPDYLLSKAVTTEFLSLNKTSEIDVISFYFDVNEENNNIINEQHSFHESIKLDQEINVNDIDSLIRKNFVKFEFLKKMLLFCKSERFKRLKCAIPTYCFYPNYKLKIDQTALIIEEELKFLVNKYTNINCGYFHDVEESQVNEWCSDVISNCNLKFSPLVSSRLGELYRSRRNTKGYNLRLSKQFLEQILKDKTINIFKCESLFPDTGIYHRYWKKITGTDITHLNMSSNIVLLNITNPLSCYLDIYSQRIFKDGNLDDEQIQEIYENFKMFEMRMDKYWSICKGYEIRHKFNEASFILDCVYDTFNEEKVFFHCPLLDDVNCQDFLTFQSLNLNKVPIVESLSERSLKFIWRTRIFSYDTANEELKNYDPVNLDDIYSFESKIDYRLIKDDIDEDDIENIQTILETNKYCENLTSEIVLNIDPMMTLEYSIKDRQLMRIQFTYEYNEGIMKIVPELLIINPDFRVCLGHRNDPLKYFLHPYELSNINYKRFRDTLEYRNQFIILNRFEGIYQTINSESSYFIHDLKINWLARKEEDKEDIYGIVILEESWCRERFLKLVHDNMKLLDPVHAINEAVSKNKMEYLLCVQSFIKERGIYWVGHCRIAGICPLDDGCTQAQEKNKKMKNTNYRVHITFKLVHSSFPIKHYPEQLYSIELMETPISTRIFERSLRKIRMEDPFYEEIVTGRFSSHLYSKDTVNCDQIIRKMVIKCILNIAQIKALNKSVNNKFSMIWGPPGTGKTMIGCMIAFWYSIINKKKAKPSAILYCGPSNQSVDVVGEKLKNTFGVNCPKLLRIFSKDVVNYDFPYVGARIKSGNIGCPEILKDIALHYVVREPGKLFRDEILSVQEELKRYKTRNEMERIEFSKLLRKYERILKKAYEEEIKHGKYDIVLTTAASSCKKLLEELVCSQVILDECGMCSEPEAIGPILSKPDLEHVVLIGDHKQLRPIVTYNIAKGKGLEKSLFERLYGPKSKSYCTMLDTQYRMHPSICEFPSIHFYKGEDEGLKLKTALCESWTGIPDDKITDDQFNGLQYARLYKNYEKDLKKNNVKIADDIWLHGCKEGRRSNFKCYPKDIDFSGPKVLEKIKFINTIGTEISQEISCNTGGMKSKGNMLEVKSVVHIYKKLISKMHSKAEASQSILVITQYRLQEFHLKEQCALVLEKHNIPGVPRVSTVVKSQGSESDYVIFSTVRSLPSLDDIDTNPSPGWMSKYLGFITDVNQLNVALTRAKKGLFIIGNSHLLSVNETWKALIVDLKRRQCFIDNILQIY